MSGRRLKSSQKYSARNAYRADRARPSQQAESLSRLKDDNLDMYLGRSNEVRIEGRAVELSDMVSDRIYVIDDVNVEQRSRT